MNNISIRSCTVDELAQMPQMHVLLSEYAAECAIEGLGATDAQIDTYRHMEAAHLIHPLGAFLDGFLIGFLVLLVLELPLRWCLLIIAMSFTITR